MFSYKTHIILLESALFAKFNLCGVKISMLQISNIYRR